MNPRCPVDNKLEIPTFLASTLGSISPLRISDGPVDQLIVCACPTGTIATYVRAEVAVLNEGRVARITACLRPAGIGMTHMDVNDITSHAFTTILPTMNNNCWTFKGSIHQSHYENEDIPKALLTSFWPDGITAFENISFVVGYRNNEAVVNAIAAAAPPGVTAAAAVPGRRVAACYTVNQRGIQPAIGAANTAGHVPADVYIIGRDSETAFQVMIAHHLSVSECYELHRHRLIAP